MTTDELDTWRSGPPDRSCTTPEERAHCKRCGGSFPGGYRSCPYDATPLVVGADPLIGSIIGDRYQIERFLGEGGLGRVYAAQHTRLPRRFAVKVPSGRAATDPRSRERFLREARVASRLDHPNVVAVVDSGETAEGLLYLVMELADGETLTAHLRRRGAMRVHEALLLTRQIALGLEHAHRRGLVHRDLKPDNVIVERADGRPRILDFGLAILAAPGDAGRLTSRRTVVGTPHYMSPEHVCGFDLDGRSDLFSLGIMLYQMLAGRMPFDATPIEIAQRYVHDRVPRFAERVPGLVVDPEAEALCRRLIAVDRDARPAHAADLIRALDAILDRLAATGAGLLDAAPVAVDREPTARGHIVPRKA
jgi:serine/threonine-protein kinase